jgi:hypothetical protein
MDLRLINIARQAHLGFFLKKKKESAISNIENLSLLVSKIEKFTEFTNLEKKQTRVSAIISSISYFENYMNDILLNILICYPEKLGKKQFDIGDLKVVGSIYGLIELKANQTVLELAYGRFDSYIEKISGLLELKKTITRTTEFTSLISQVNEIKATRDVFIHNNGKVNAIYKDKAKDCLRENSIGADLKVEYDYFITSIDYVINFIELIDTGIADNYKNLTPRKIFKVMWNYTCINNRVKFEDAWNVTSDEEYRLRDREENYGFSSSELEIYNFFRDIYSNEKLTNFPKLFLKFGPSTIEHQIVLSWLNTPFWL